MSASSVFRRTSRSDDRAAVLTTPAAEDTSEDNEDKPKNPIMRFFDAVRSTNREGEMKELDEFKNVVKIVPQGNGRETVGGFDICKEYSYSGDEDDNNYFFDPANEKVPAIDDDEDVIMTNLLGRSYHPIRDFAQRRDDESSLFWFTYRCDFPEIAPYNITSDAGWGCMLRSAQMMLGQALRLHFKSRGWRPVHALTRRRQDPFVRSILTWFADFASATENVYSLHNMVAAGLAYDKLPGEWYGPGTACYVVRDLVKMHEKNQSANRKMFRVYVAPQGTVYRNQIEDLMTRDNKARAEQARKEKIRERPPQHPLDVAWEEELVESVDQIEWDTALLLLIPLRLGLQTFNKDYEEAVAFTFSLPQSVGVLGGRPRGARWFYGALADGSKIFGLDPHTVQSAPRKRAAVVNGKQTSTVELSDDYLRSVHTTYPEVFSLQKMDPSIALGFYCSNRKELEHLIASLRQWKHDHPTSPELFTATESAPDYGSNQDDMLMNMTGSLLDVDNDQLSDEDEYVML